MIGLLLIVMAAILFIFAVYMDIIASSEGTTPLIQKAKKIRASANMELILHEIPLLILALGFALFVDESGNLFLQEAFPTYTSRIYGFPFLALIVIMINIARHRRFGIGIDEETAVLCALEEVVDEAMTHEAMTPEEGLLSAINYVKSRPTEFDENIVESLLIFLARRDDAVGKISRNRLSTIK
jgi:energy-converting hydrogenase Eha subunit A